MEIWKEWPRELPSAVAALGTFDGVHRGHRALLCRALTLAREAHKRAAVITFSDHPLSVLAPEKAPSLLTTGEERAALLEGLGLETLMEVPFTPEMAGTEPEAFVALLCGRLGLRQLVVGYNYSFGRGGRGTPEQLARLAAAYGCRVEVLPPVTRGDAPVSASRIRHCLEAGETAEAARLLGRPYSLGGPIVKGKQLGRALDFPTLNIDYPREKALPAPGVYTGWIRWPGGLVPAVTNLGTNPTVEEGPCLRLESHALRPIPLVYGDRAEVLLGVRLRGETRFPSVEALRSQVEKDKARARDWAGAVTPEAFSED